jgi:bifunctional DNA-binding transcriptional regulator/antitoxin component of YhaV-PrlF toxin-antitoxin module
MPRKRPSAAAYSRVSVKSQTVLPKQVREVLDVKPGDTLRYRITAAGVVLDKAPARSDADDPFASFTEWSGAADDAAYDDL